MAASPGNTVIHLLDWAECGPPGAWSIGALRAHDCERTHRVVLLGRRGDAVAAERWLGGPVDAVRAMVGPRLLLPRDLVIGDVVSPVRVVAWSWRALRASRWMRVWAGGIDVGAFGLRPLVRGGGRFVEALAGEGKIAFGSSWSRDSSDLDGCAVLPVPMPGVERRSSKPERGWFDLDDAADRLTIAGVGWPGRSVSSTRVSYIAGVLSIGGHASAAIVPADSEDLERATRFAHRHNDAWPVFAVDAADSRHCAAADVALWCGHPGAMLDADGNLPAGVRSKRPAPLAESLLVPLAMGVPIVAESVAATRELLGTDLASDPVEPLRWLTPAGDRLTMNRAAYTMLTQSEPSRAEHARHAAAIRAKRDPRGFARSFGAWVDGWGDGAIGTVTPARGATSF